MDLFPGIVSYHLIIWLLGSQKTVSGRYSSNEWKDGFHAPTKSIKNVRNELKKKQKQINLKEKPKAKL